MGNMFCIYSRAGYYLSAKRFLFSPVPGLFSVQQPVYHYTNRHSLWVADWLSITFSSNALSLSALAWILKKQSWLMNYALGMG
jgi:hypothetical protein